MIERLAEQLLKKALSDYISDIHIVPQEASYNVYYRYSVELVPVLTLDYQTGEKLINYFKYVSHMDVGEKRKPQSSACHLQIHQEDIELRTSTICHFSGSETLVIRLLQRTRHYELIQFFPKQLERLVALCHKKQGLIVFSGPVNSGKTTLMHAILSRLYSESVRNIVTIEDPVEIVNPHFLQTEINELAKVDYDSLIKASLRHHPDILLVGEIRDEKTATMAVRAALTGHLVVTTVHAQSCHGVVERLIDLSVNRSLLQEVLVGIVTQRLLPRYCQLCVGSCHRYCTHIRQQAKRALLFHLLSGQALKQYWRHPTSHSLNRQLEKAYACQFIDEDYVEAYWIEE